MQKKLTKYRQQVVADCVEDIAGDMWNIVLDVGGHTTTEAQWKLFCRELALQIFLASLGYYSDRLSESDYSEMYDAAHKMADKVHDRMTWNDGDSAVEMLDKSP